MPRLLLVRHGESEWNALGRWQGQADPPLSAHGQHQASAAAQRLGALDAVVASTLQRASETAAIIAQSLGVGPVKADDRLIERDAGEWSGLTRSQINRDWPGYLSNDPDSQASERRPPGWESDRSLLLRTEAALIDVVGSLGDDDHALVVTHGGVIYAFEAHLGAPRQYLPNLGARWLEAAMSSKGLVLNLGERVHLYDPDTNPYEADSTPPDSEAV